MGNSLAKLPLTSPSEQWEEEEKQSNEDIYSHVWICIREPELLWLTNAI